MVASDLAVLPPTVEPQLCRSVEEHRRRRAGRGSSRSRNSRYGDFSSVPRVEAGAAGGGRQQAPRFAHRRASGSEQSAKPDDTAPTAQEAETIDCSSATPMLRIRIKICRARKPNTTCRYMIPIHIQIRGPLGPSFMRVVDVGAVATLKCRKSYLQTLPHAAPFLFLGQRRRTQSEVLLRIPSSCCAA